MESLRATGALAGIKVIDMSHQAAGPWCTSLLGDMGADVIKVEKPGRGDSIRYADRTGRLPPEVGGPNFQGLNRNKRGITIDISKPAGVSLLRRLIMQSDVLVENFRPGVMDRHGLGWQHVQPLNERLVYCSITAFGPKGPLAQKPGMDLIVQATGGIMGHTGEEGGPPIKSAPPVADINTGVYAAYGIIGALFARVNSGKGQHVEVAMLDAVVSLFADNACNVLTDGTKFGKFGSGHPDLVPYQAFPAKDGSDVLQANGVAVGDLSGDGKPEVVVVTPRAPNANGRGGRILVAGASGAWTSGSLALPNPAAADDCRGADVALSDVDGDGDLDLVIVRDDADETVRNTRVLRNPRQ